MDKSLKYNKKGLELFKKMKNNAHIAFLLNNMGGLYGDMGEYELAVEHLEECLNLYEQNPHSLFNIQFPLSNLIEVTLEHGDNERAQKYFHRLEDIYNQKRNNNIVTTGRIIVAICIPLSISPVRYEGTIIAASVTINIIVVK